MIPLKLKLRNFMCYRDNVPPLDFQGIHVACLTGDNGHGKSALLDAITWALWGRSRTADHDALIHLGQTEMEVEFEFALENTRYCVIRKRRKGDGRRSGQTILELQVWNGERYQPITEPTVRATEERLCQLLRLDYDTFINSAFLVQGRADEFATKRPGERKQVLANILGLDIYDRYEELAKERAHERAAIVNVLSQQIRLLDEEIAHKPEYEEQEREAARQVAELSSRLREAERKLEELQACQRDLFNQQRELNDLEQRVRRDAAELSRLESQLQESRSRLQALEETIARRDEIEAGYQRWQEAREMEEAWREKQLALSRLQTEQARLEGEIRAAQASLQAEIRALEAQIAQWRNQVARIPELENAAAEANERLKTLESQATEAAALRQRLTALGDEAASLRAQNELLKAEMESLKERLELLQAASAVCPLCGQPLVEADRARLVQELEADGKARGDQFRINVQRIKTLEVERRAVEGRLQELERELKAQTQWQRQATQAEMALAEARRSAEALAEAEAKLANLCHRLERGEYAPEARAALARLSEQEQEIGYDADAHRRAQEAVVAWAQFETRYADLQRALASIEAEQRSVTQLTARCDALRAALAEDRQRCDALRARLEALPQIEEAVREQDRVVLELATQEQRARELLGAAQQRLATCQALEQTRAQRMRELQQAREEQAIYEELREAFGKRGLQAMIIEAAIPEIEDEANRLLTRMTDGRLFVSLETTRTGKTTGDPIETLDIIIRDELGPRPYEMFSGGESFRVNFALRIALSKLLARRAGTRLRTLFIDEGFGSQDAQGRLRLVEAIQSIQDDFERILVITHIEELKEMFPVRIDIVKTPEGSQISLS
ncbi:MAG: SMC family ATPase [Anaerolineae bacterium]|nr:SMC family ATPase [Anaerolineae bacterium]MDW8099367.1 SMC family ATPase [Anaerolineae bacterium]